MATRQPLRVLCLAGFRQSERGFREKTGALRKALRGRADLVCLSGPHPIVDGAGLEGAGPESGETRFAQEMRAEVSILPRPDNTLQHPPPLCILPFLLPPHFILPIPFIFSVPASQDSTLISLSLYMPGDSPSHFPQTQTSLPSASSLAVKPSLPFSFFSSWIPPFPNPILSPISS